ncbi:putative DNA-binding transcriptional regulator YafY [Virgibacillus natechei]|uniref:DNA-binding transcriptional regulator YafY n=1 Tax=Virgibacillus natechei TaxID=1216297 RepID=A0ABS4IF73_9BACI|nr:hypothetical protein [Virgibacillus natechei]MBP1969116.1 putative DNA-binding transcriptional regulator YafY [Virgibacillus natechei]UZD14382.1 hypothetical protein OLD84_07725 [Virgibacillus natechei]
MKGLLTRSVESKEKMVIFYIDSRGQVTQRYIRVLQVNDGLILAYCYYRKEVRVFKLDNILSAGPIKKRVGA